MKRLPESEVQRRKRLERQAFWLDCLQRAHESTGGDEVRTLQACMVTLHEQLAQATGNAYTAQVLKEAYQDYRAAASFEEAQKRKHRR